MKNAFSLYQWLMLLFKSPILALVRPLIARESDDEIVFCVPKKRFLMRNFIDSPNLGALMMLTEAVAAYPALKNLGQRGASLHYLPLLRSVETPEGIKMIAGDMMISLKCDQWRAFEGILAGNHSEAQELRTAMKNIQITVQVYGSNAGRSSYPVRYAFSLIRLKDGRLPKA